MQWPVLHLIIVKTLKIKLKFINFKQSSTDFTEIIKKHGQKNDYPKFEKEMIVSINTI